MAISNANANGIPFIKNMRGIPKSIRDAMVLWYDIAKQKTTNESMAANPILKDLSRNGNDATCYNFAWSGMSGIGGYSFADFQELPNRSVYIKNGYKFIFTEKLSTINNFLNLTNCIGNKSVKIKISGLTDNRKVIFGSPVDYSLDNGEHDIIIPSDITTWPFGVTGNVGDINVSIEFLPLYPNALVSDGVDDYAMVQNKYAVDFTTDLNDYKSRADFTCTNSKIIITNNKMNGAFKELPSGTMPSFKIKVTGITNSSAKLRYGSDYISSKFVTIAEDGEYTLPAYTEETNYIGFRIINYIGECNITIEQLPINKSLVFNKENGYTIIAKRERLNDLGCLASKRNSSNTDGSFVFELNTESVLGNRCDSFNASNSISYNDNIITWQTSKKYNGITLNIGNAQDNNVLNLFMLYNNYYVQVALYSLLLFNRDLTDDEIDWIKYNLL